jgi:hypothetical protein
VTWLAVLALAIGSYGLKATGPLALGGRELPSRLASALELAVPALFAGLAAVGAFASGSTLVLDPRAAALGVALLVALVRPGLDGFLPATVAGAATAALLRALD